MTDATVLADALVEAGADQCGNDYRWIEAGVIDSLPPEQFITDWRVAGKVLESMESLQIGFAVLNHGGSYELFHSPRAIIEAWYEARQ